MSLSHLDDQGRARMVDVGHKPATARMAVAEGRVCMSGKAYQLVERQAVAKGDVLRVAELAGIMAAKRTADLIPLCHPLPLDSIVVIAALEPANLAVRIEATARTTGPTGVEMEALTAVSVACLTVYDMVKAVDREQRIEGIRLLRKTGGSSGDFEAQPRDSTAEEI
ncbi:MAG: cyclic pyranopterin monophosphate synthase MoaC [Gemmatimonadota bacterium]|nr:cyclic pyranopterin monophosphate synthase MoaC [Gemmatimonadota bacterium]